MVRRISVALRALKAHNYKLPNVRNWMEGLKLERKPAELQLRRTSSTLSKGDIRSLVLQSKGIVAAFFVLSRICRSLSDRALTARPSEELWSASRQGPRTEPGSQAGLGRVPLSGGLSGCDSRWRLSGSELVGCRGVSIAGFGEGCHGVLGEVATVRHGPFVVEV